MRIAFGATVMARGLDAGHMDGIGHYSQELLTGLQALNANLLPVVFGPSRQTVLAGLPVHLAPRFKGQALWSALTGLPAPGLGGIARQADLLLAPDHYIPKPAVCRWSRPSTMRCRCRIRNGSVAACGRSRTTSSAKADIGRSMC